MATGTTDAAARRADLTIKFIPEDLTRVAAFKTGAVDWIDAVPPAQVEEFRHMPDVSTVTEVSGNNLYVDFPTQLPNTPFKDVRVRQAAAYAIDMDAIIKRVLFGQGQRYAEIGPDETGYDPALKPYPFDPKKARALLAEAGYPKGFDTPCYNLTTPREPNVKEMGDAVFAYLSAVGIRCKVNELEYGAWINLGRRGRERPAGDGRRAELDVVARRARRPRHALGRAPAQLPAGPGLGQLLLHRRARDGRAGRAAEAHPGPGQARRRCCSRSRGRSTTRCWAA